MNKIGLRIKELRDEKHMTKAAFAAVLEVHPQRIYDIESKGTQPNEKIITGVVEKFGVNMDWLMRGIGEKYAKTDGLKEPAGGYVVIPAASLDRLMAKLELMDLEIKAIKRAVAA